MNFSFFPATKSGSQTSQTSTGASSAPNYPHESVPLAPLPHEIYDLAKHAVIGAPPGFWAVYSSQNVEAAIESMAAKHKKPTKRVSCSPSPH